MGETAYPGCSIAVPIRVPRASGLRQQPVKSRAAYDLLDHGGLHGVGKFLDAGASAEQNELIRSSERRFYVL